MDTVAPDWPRNHTRQNTSHSICINNAELMEIIQRTFGQWKVRKLFSWLDNGKSYTLYMYMKILWTSRMCRIST